MSESLVKIEMYEFICNEIAEIFADKQELWFGGWIGNNIGEVADFSDLYTFSLSDIILDLKKEMPKGFIIQWSEDCVESYFKSPDNDMINYKSYIMGARFNETKNSIK